MRVPSFALICCCCCTHAFLEARKLVGSEAASGLDKPLKNSIEIRDDHAFQSAAAIEPCADNECKYQLLGNDDDNDGEIADGTDWSGGKVWGYAILANTVVVSVSVIGLVLIKCQSEKQRRVIFDFFIGLAASVMMGDAFFHMLPHMLGLHDDEDDHGDDHNDNDEHLKEAYMNIGKIGVMVAAIYLMWLVGALMRLTGRSHGHSHDPEPQSSCHANVTPTTTVSNEESTINIQESKEVETLPKTETSFEQENKTPEKPKLDWSVMGGILIGDCGCNFTDGLAIGVSWTFSWGAGVAATLAIMVHEIPHELGDFVLFQKLGMSMRGALLANFLSACWSYVGLFIGLGLGQNPEAADWLISMVAGLFIYIALVNVMPNMRIENNESAKWTRLMIQNAGVLLGFSIMIAIAIIEENDVLDFD